MNKVVKLTLSLLFFLAVPTAAMAQDVPPATIKIQMSKSSVRAGEPVMLLVTVINTSGASLRIFSASGQPNGGRAETDYSILVRNKSGELLARKDGKKVVMKDGAAVRMPLGFPSRRPIMIDPGSSFEDYMVLGRLFDLKAPGTYSVRLLRDFSTGPKREIGRVAVQSNVIEFTIMSKPPQ